MGKDGWGKRLCPLVLPGYSLVLFTLFQSVKHCSILKHSKVTWNPRRHATSTFLSLGDFPTVMQAPGFPTSSRIISAKCSVWNRGKGPGPHPLATPPPQCCGGSGGEPRPQPPELLGSIEHSWAKTLTQAVPPLYTEQHLTRPGTWCYFIEPKQLW